MSSLEIRTVPVMYKAIDLESEAAKKRYWGAYERMRTRWYGAVELQVRKRFQEELRAIHSSIRSVQPQDTIAAALRTIDEQEEHWAKLLQAIYVSVGEQFAPTVADTLNPSPKSIRPKRTKGLLTDLWMSFILNYIKTQSSTKVRRITDTTREFIRAELSEGVRNGETIGQLAERVRICHTEMTPARSMLIARTEVINASNAASVAGAKASGAAVKKQWLASRDDRVRKDHEEADGQTLPLGEPFIVGGYQLMWPGDPSMGAPGKEVINCRCTVIYVR